MLDQDGEGVQQLPRVLDPPVPQEAGPIPAVAPFQYLSEELLLGGEVIVEGALGDADRGQDVFDGGRLVPLGEEEAAGGVEDLLLARGGVEVLGGHISSLGSDDI